VRVAATLVVALSACGRIGFDSLEASDALPSDAASDGSATDSPLGDPSLALYMPFEGPSDAGFLSTNEYPTACGAGGCPTPDVGRVGAQSAAFGSNQCIYIGASTLRPPQFTFAAWVFVPVPQNMTAFARPYEGMTGTDNSFEIYTDNGSAWRVIVNGVQTGTNATLNEWHHIAGVHEGETVKMYLDGAFETEIATGPVEYTVEDLLVGCDINFGIEADHFDGQIDDIRLYTRVLSDTELAALAN
jgi:hypothetical protein